MQLYEIALPDKRNDPRSFKAAAFGYAPERLLWENEAFSLAGGFTRLGTRDGFWKDPDTNKTYGETMHWYQIAVEDHQIITDLVEKAGELFPDQLAFFVAKIGTAENVSMAKNFAEAMS